MNRNAIVEKLQEAMTSFGVMRKAIAYSIQNRLLYVLTKSQGWATTKIGTISNFQSLLKMGNHFCGITVCCALAMLCKGLFTMLVTLIYMTMCRMFLLGFFCELFILLR